MKYLFTFFIGVLLVFEGAGQKAELVKDIYPLKRSGLYSNFFENSDTTKNYLIFNGNNSTDGEELWRSDGTEKGTEMLVNFNEGGSSSSSSPSYFFSFKNLVIFSIIKNNKYQMWKTEGSFNSTKQIWDVGGSASRIKNDTSLYILSLYNGLLEKSIEDFSYKTIINTTFYNTNPRSYCKLNNKWIFNNGSASQGLFSNNGGEENQKIITINRGFFETYSQLEKVNENQAFFVNDDGRNGNELWVTDGSIVGTKMVKNIAPAGNGSFYGLAKYNTLNKVKNGLVFLADDGTNGLELYVSDGTEIGTRILKDFTPGKDGTSFLKFFKFNFDKENVYFEKFAENWIEGTEIWKTDGTLENTIRVFKTKNGIAQSDSYDSQTTFFYEKNSKIYFLIYLGSGKYEIWSINGKPNGEVKYGTVNNIESAPYFHIVGNNFLYAGSDEEHGTELWKFPLCTHSAKITTANGTTFCPGSSVSISGEGTGTTSPFTYSWKSGTTDAGTNASLTVSKAGNYTLEVKDKEGCVVSASVDITQTANLPVAITGINSICSGQNTTLTATPTGGEGPYTYQWKLGGANLGTNTSTLAANTGGSYTVEIKDKNGCVGTAPNFSITAKASPNVTITKSGSQDFLPGSSIELSVPTATGQTYQWNKNGTAIPGATNNSYTVTTEGKYTVTVVGNGCTVTSEPLETKLITGTEQEPVLSNIRLDISPNPAVDFVKVTIDLPKPSKAELQLKDIAGKTVHEHFFGSISKQHKTTLNLGAVPAGVYFVNVESSGERVVRKVLK
jgi:ELWxxDGT repeat protein